MHFPAVAAIFALLVSTVTIASPISDESNAQRLARGLPPRSPKFGRTLPGVVPPLVDNATPVAMAKRSNPSGTSGTMYTGRLLVRYDTTNGGSPGYVRNWSGGGSISGVNFLGTDEELHVKFTVPASGSFDVLATNPNFPAPYFVGAAGSTTENYGKASVLAFTNVAQSPAGARPDGSGSESAIWTFDVGSKRLSAHWVNPDGTSTEAHLAYDVRENELFFAGDIATWEQNHSDYFASPVSIYLADI